MSRNQEECSFTSIGHDISKHFSKKIFNIILYGTKIFRFLILKIITSVKVLLSAGGLLDSGTFFLGGG